MPFLVDILCLLKELHRIKAEGVVINLCFRRQNFQKAAGIIL